MSDDKLDQILLKLDAIEKRQGDDLHLLTGALDRLSEDIRAVDTRVASVASDLSHARREIAQLRAEHGGYLRAIQKEAEGLDRRVTVLEGKT